MMTRQVACFHISEWPTWTRQQQTPRQKLLGVYEHERVISCNAALYERGLRRGEHVDRARILYTDAVFHPRDRHLEEATWEDMLMMLNGATPNLKSLQPGWALLAPWDLDSLGLFTRTLLGCTGVASRRLVAMLAALQAGEGETLVVPEEMAGTFLDVASVRHLLELGFSIETVERLELFGLSTVGRLMKLTRRHLVAQFGGEGAALFQLLHPDEEPAIPLFQPPPSVTLSYTFDPPVLEPGEILPVLRLLVHKGVPDLGGLLAQRVAARLHGEGVDGKRFGSRVLKAPTSQPYRIYVAAELLVRTMLRADSPVEQLEVELGGLVQPSAIQGDLFFNRYELYDAVKQIHRRYPNTLFRAVITNPHAYLPEEGITLEPYPDTPQERKRRRRR